MQSTIFQALVLVTHGNMLLSGRTVANFYPQHPAFNFDEFVRFVDLDRGDATWNELPFAENPNEWLAKLRAQGCAGLRVERISTEKEDLSDRMSVGFVGGGGRWIIEAVFSGGSDYWEAKWEVGNQDHPEQNIWQVTYARVAKNQASGRGKSISVESLSNELGQVLQDAIAFSRKHQLDWFGKAFESGYAALMTAAEPELNGIAPNGQLPLAATRLLAASQDAWVFGGMGSWNDQGFAGDDQRQYEIISDRLFRLINSSLVVASNQSFPQAEKSWWKFWP